MRVAGGQQQRRLAAVLSLAGEQLFGGVAELLEQLQLADLAVQAWPQVEQALQVDYQEQ